MDSSSQRQSARKQDGAKEKTLKHQVTLVESPPDSSSTTTTNGTSTTSNGTTTATTTTGTATTASKSNLAAGKTASALKASATSFLGASLASSAKRTSSSHWAKLRNLTSALDSLRWLRLKEKAKDPKLLFKLRDELTGSLQAKGFDETCAANIHSFQVAFTRHLHCTQGKDLLVARKRDFYVAVANTVRDYLMARWQVTREHYRKKQTKRVYYLSMEYFLGRTLTNAMINMGIDHMCKQALYQLGLEIEEIKDEEMDAGLGNGGLGRLAACFMDSLATLAIPATGYGLRYEFGIFQQAINNGYQEEIPDDWLALGNPWEVPRVEHAFLINFYGHSSFDGAFWTWVPGQTILAQAYDSPIPGYRNGICNSLRLWSAKSTRSFDLHYFNHGDYIQAVLDRNMAENVTRILYPNDSFLEGKELRLKQEFLLVSATLQDIMWGFKRSFDHDTDFRENIDFNKLPDSAAIQLNDTHPALAVPELMRLLMDSEHLGWDEAWFITSKCLSYTNHTILPEALERWSMKSLSNLLPRHAQIVVEINRRFMERVTRTNPHIPAHELTIVEDGQGDQHVNMARLCLVACDHVNGVAKLHSDILRNETFKYFHQLWPMKIQNKTNGVTPRRWLMQCNPELTTLINSKIGTNWVARLSELERLKPLANDKDFLIQLRNVKQQNKKNLALHLSARYHVDIDPESIFDMQIKRIHEYKRQLLVLFHVISMYNDLHDNPSLDIPARTVFFAGKAAPAYSMAKLIIKLICSVSDVVNHDHVTCKKLKLLFLENYRVSLAEQIIPSADISEQVSTAGMEASGTSNMKFMTNGALTCGTLDGANVEIQDKCGPENAFIFGMTVDEVEARKAAGYNPRAIYENSPKLKRIIDQISTNYFCPTEPGIFAPIVENLLKYDRYFVLADFDAYIKCQDRINKVYADKADWSRRCLMNIASSGYFSSDRTIEEYNRDIWHVPEIPPFTLTERPACVSPIPE